MHTYICVLFAAACVHNIRTNVRFSSLEAAWLPSQDARLHLSMVIAPLLSWWETLRWLASWRACQINRWIASTRRKNHSRDTVYFTCITTRDRHHRVQHLWCNTCSWTCLRFKVLAHIEVFIVTRTDFAQNRNFRSTIAKSSLRTARM